MAEHQSTAPTLTRANPARHMTQESDVMAPFWQSVVWGILVTLLAECGAFVWMDSREAVNPRTLLYLALIAFPLVSLAAWARSQGVARATLWAYETARDEDIDGDGYKGKPPPAEVRLLKVYSAPADDATEPLTPHEGEKQRQLCEFVRGCWLDGKPNTSQATWVPLIGRSQWDEYRALLLDLGHAVEDRPGFKNSPWRLRHDATTTIRNMFGPSPRPTARE